MRNPLTTQSSVRVYRPFSLLLQVFFYYLRVNFTHWWRGQDSNLRSTRRQIYSLLGLTAPQPLLLLKIAGNSAADTIPCQLNLIDLLCFKEL